MVSPVTLLKGHIVEEPQESIDAKEACIEPATSENGVVTELVESIQQECLDGSVEKDETDRGPDIP